MSLAESKNNYDDFKTRWEQAISLLQKEIEPQVFSAFIRPLEFKSYNYANSEVVVNAPSRLIKNHVTERFGAKFTTLLNHSDGHELSYTNRLVRIIFDVCPQAQSTAPAPLVLKKLQAPIRPLLAKSSHSPNLNKNYCFDNFVVGSNNELSYELARQAAEMPGKKYSPLFIYGGVGLGKTHLLHAIGNHALQKNPGLNVYYTTAENFTNSLIAAIKNNSINDFKNHLRKLQILLIDDVQFFSGKERTQEEFFHTFNALHETGAQIVLTADSQPKDIVGLEERLKNRLSWGISTDLLAPDTDTRLAILSRKAAFDGIELPPEVSEMLAKNISSNVRELEGALNRLRAIASLRREKVTLELAQSALKEILQPQKTSLTISDIKLAVARFFNISPFDLSSKRRNRNISRPRHIAMHLCRKLTSASYPEIGFCFGGRDHSSVIHAASSIAEKLHTDSVLKNEVDKIEKQLRG